METRPGRQGDSIFVRVKQCMVDKPWCYQGGLIQPSSEDFEVLTPENLTEEQAEAVSADARSFPLDDVQQCLSGTNARWPMAQQPCERFAWVCEVVWAWNVSRGICSIPNCGRQMRLVSRAFEKEDDIREETGKKRRGPTQDAFTLQRRWNKVRPLYELSMSA